MQARFGKNSTIAAGILLCASLAVAQRSVPNTPDGLNSAQNPTQRPAGRGAAVSPGKAGGAPEDAAASGEQQPTDTGAVINGLYDKKPQDGSAAQSGQKLNEYMVDRAAAAEAVGGTQITDKEKETRFEQFLSAAAVPQQQLQAYNAMVRTIDLELRQSMTFDAWKRLYVLGDAPEIDGGVSRELANRIESIWNAGDTSGRLAYENGQLRKDIKTANRNADVLSDTIRQHELEMARAQGSAMKSNTRSQGNSRGGQQQQQQQQQQPNGGVPKANPMGGADGGGGAGFFDSAQAVSPPPDPTSLMGKLELTDEYLSSLEARAKIRYNQLKSQQLLDQVKQEFGDYVSTLAEGGWYSHVVIAADFYRRLFNEGDYPVKMTEKVNESLKKSREVYATVDVFKYKASQGDLQDALTRLADAFVNSEYHPALLGLSREEKAPVARYLSQLNQLRNLLEARDYGKVEAFVAKIKQSCNDFDETKTMALADGAKLEASMRLGKAKLYAQQGDNETAMEEFETAAKTWPRNPDLKDKAFAFFDTQDVKSQSVVEFDRMVSEKNYRGIFEKQLGFAIAVKGDKAREDAFANALKRIKDAEMASEKANALIMNGDVIGAWEAVALASEGLPDDAKLNRLRADLSARSAEFVSAISKAKEAEARKDLGYSLTWYVIAQKQYPVSQIANSAIDRLGKQILASSL